MLVAEMKRAGELDITLRGNAYQGPKGLWLCVERHIAGSFWLFFEETSSCCSKWLLYVPCCPALFT